jgi:hypothetical protein
LIFSINMCNSNKEYVCETSRKRIDKMEAVWLRLPSTSSV